jgi:curved DNA-binding protein
VRAKLAIPLEFAYAGGTQAINVDGRMLQVKIPAGIRPGQVIRLAGQGQGHGAHRSDLLLEIEYKPHGEFEVDGRNVLYAYRCQPWDAALGRPSACPRWEGRSSCAFRPIPTPDASCGCAAEASGQAAGGRPDRGNRSYRAAGGNARAARTLRTDGGTVRRQDARLSDQPGTSNELITSTSWFSVNGLVM